MTAATSRIAEPARTSFRYALDDLLDLDAPELLSLYEGASVPKITDLDGDLVGRMLVSPYGGARLAKVMRALGRWDRFPWIAVPKAAASVGLLIGYVSGPFAITAAIGLVVLMAGALTFRLRIRDSAGFVLGDAVILGLAAAIAVSSA